MTYEEIKATLDERTALHNDYYVNWILPEIEKEEGEKVEFALVYPGLSIDPAVGKDISLGWNVEYKKVKLIKQRIIKKRAREERELREFLEWLRNLRMYLIEANGDSFQERMIIQQFKEKIKATDNHQFRNTLMGQYAKLAKGNDW